ncbi:MAG: PrsW family intramembrane metalloprotease [Thermoplasmata archaeon]|nr:MAG: PrsW family intramembrane metalloprotease [Thermoplasmata archaeon]
MSSSEVLYFIILILLAFVPALLYVRWFRNLEQYEREPYTTLISVFAYGAFLAVFFAVLLEYALYRVLMYEYELHEVLPFSTFLILVIIIAPISEEFIKPLGIVLRAKKDTNEVEDGIIYGAACGLGFAATENLMYGSAALWAEGVTTASLLIAVRTISSTLLHASATAITGYGIGLWLVRKKPFSVIFPYFIFAVLLHALFNLMAMTNTIFGLIFAIMIAVLATDFVKRKIIELDQRQSLKEVVDQIKKR